MNPVIFETRRWPWHLMLGGDTRPGPIYIWSGRLDPARSGRLADGLAG